MKQPKALFVLNIIVFIILILALALDGVLVVNIVKAKTAMDNNPDNSSGENLGHGLAIVYLLVLHLFMLIPYLPCVVISIVSMCKKYFNWLSIANASMGVLAIVLTISVFIIV